MSRPQLQASDQAQIEVLRCRCRCLGVRLGGSIHLRYSRGERWKGGGRRE
jgi:hypothetical protein